MPTEIFISKSMMYIELDIDQLNRLQMFNDRLKNILDELPRNSTGKRARYFEQIKVMELFIQQNIKKFPRFNRAKYCKTFHLLFSLFSFKLYV